jgi:hypothetical protein
MNWYKISQVTLEKPEQTMENLGSPEINVYPYEPLIREAVDELKSESPGIFDQITDIIVDLGYGQFGSVQSPTPNTIRINLNKIKEEIRRESGITNENDPQFKAILKYKVKEVIIHEHSHVQDEKIDTTTGNITFPGGESIAERAQQEFVSSHPFPNIQ